MPEALKWYFQLFDKMSGPAAKITQSVDAVNKALKNVKSTAGASSSGLFSGIASGIWSAVSGAISLGGSLANIASTAMSAASAVAGIGASFVSTALDSLAFKDETLASLSVLTGSELEGNVSFNAARAIDRITSFNTRGVVDATRMIRSAGFSAEEFDPIFAVSSDLAAMSGKGTQGLELATYALGQINNAGRLYTQDLRQLLNLGLSRGRFNEAIARSMNLTETGPALSRRINKMLEQGQIDSPQAISAIMDAVQQQTGGGPLGTLSTRMGSSLSGQLSNIKNSFENFFLNLDLNSPALMQLRQFLINISTALDAASPAGQRLQAVFNRMFVEIGTFLGRITMDDITNLFTRISSAAMTGIDGVKKFIKGMGDFLAIINRVKDFGDTFDAIGKNVKNFFSIFQGVGKFFQPMFDSVTRLQQQLGIFTNLGTVLLFLGKVVFAVALVFLYLAFGAIMSVVVVAGLISTVVVTVVDSFMWLAGTIGKGFISLKNDFIEYGGELIRGLAQGITSAASTAVEAVGSVATGIKTRFTSFFGIHSPSTLMAGYGENIQEGLAIGLQRGRSNIDTSMDLQGGLGRGEGGLGRSITIGQITIMVDARGASDPDAVGSALGEQAPTALIQALEEWLRGSQ